MLRGDERDVDVGRETKRENTMAEEGEMAKYKTGRLEKKERDLQRPNQVDLFAGLL